MRLLGLDMVVSNGKKQKKSDFGKVSLICASCTDSGGMQSELLPCCLQDEAEGFVCKCG